MLDLVIRNAEVCDGTGAPRFHGDIAVQGDTIVGIGSVAEPARTTIDAAGLMAAPGFIDVHTHYDCQVSWDPFLTPSGWHGVTTVVIGNCGFTIAPCHASDRELLMRMLLYVEGMPTEALAAGIRWEWETFPQYLDALARWQPALNVAAFVGHSAIRYFVMREAATERAATDEELSNMCRLLEDAVRAGAWGFSSSESPTHFFGDGTPVPSRIAPREELLAFARTLRPLERGVMEIAPRNLLGTADDKIQDQHFYAMLAEASGKLVSWAPLLHNPFEPEGALRVIEDAAHLQARGLRVVPQVGCRPLEVRITFGSSSIATENNPFWRPILAKPKEERAELLRSAAFRNELRSMSQGGGWVAALGPSWQAIFLRWSPSEQHTGWMDRSVAEIAAARGADEVDTLLDLSLETDLACQWGIPIMNNDERIVGQLLRHPAGLLALSDAGAHVDTLADHSFTTHLLGHWVRELQALSWEEGVRLLTSVPARLYGIHNRGQLRVGSAADIVLFDPASVSPARTELRRDLPGGAYRLVQPARGVEYVFVNGRAIVAAGRPTEERPGLVLGRSNGRSN
ncbi:MAG: amidohydrolase family protein [Candidatus Binatia bacterium]|nr:amidohydrolase family protein [Candidatus Binatia bacterium]